MAFQNLMLYSANYNHLDILSCVSLTLPRKKKILWSIGYIVKPTARSELSNDTCHFKIPENFVFYFRKHILCKKPITVFRL